MKKRESVKARVSIGRRDRLAEARDTITAIEKIVREVIDGDGGVGKRAALIAIRNECRSYFDLSQRP